MPTSPSLPSLITATPTPPASATAGDRTKVAQPLPGDDVATVPALSIPPLATVATGFEGAMHDAMTVAAPVIQGQEAAEQPGYVWPAPHVPVLQDGGTEAAPPGPIASPSKPVATLPGRRRAATAVLPTDAKPMAEPPIMNPPQATPPPPVALAGPQAEPLTGPKVAPLMGAAHRGEHETRDSRGGSPTEATAASAPDPTPTAAAKIGTPVIALPNGVGTSTQPPSAGMGASAGDEHAAADKPARPELHPAGTRPTQAHDQPDASPSAPAGQSAPPPFAPASAAGQTIVAPAHEAQAILSGTTPLSAVASPPPASTSPQPAPQSSPSATTATPIPAAPASAPMTAAAQLAPAFVALSTPSQAGAPQRLLIRLDPAGLGHVQVRIDRAADGPAHVVLAVERSDTLMLLLQDRPQLNQALNAAGVSPEGRTLQFSLADPGSGSSSGGAGGGGGAGHSPPGRDNADGEPQPRQRSASILWQRAGVDITA